MYIIVKCIRYTNITRFVCIGNNGPFNAYGSLTMGRTIVNYGTATGFTTNTAGLMMECADYTEICVHDANTRVASFMYHDGIFNHFFLVEIKDGE